MEDAGGGKLVLAARIEAELRLAGDPGRAVQEKRYLKSELEHFGVRAPAIRRIARSALPRQPAPEHDDLVDLVTALWTRPVHECRMAAVELLAWHVDVLDARDVALVERLIKESKTWALVDVLAANVTGSLVERCPDFAAAVDRWSADEDVWIRRSALLALLGPLRRGEGDFDRFSRYADAMLDEREFFIRKAIGWVLRETAKQRPDLVFGWLMPRARRASGVTLREAVKYLTDEQRERIEAARMAGPR